MIKKNLLRANCGKYFPRQGKHPADYRLLMFSCLEDSFIFTQGSKWPMDRSYKQTKKKKTKILFRSDLSITSLFWTHWRCSLHMDLGLQTFPIHHKQTGLGVITMHGLTGTAGSRSHLEFVLLRKCWETEGGGVSDVRLSVRPTYKFLFPFYVLLLLSIKPTICQRQVD